MLGLILLLNWTSFSQTDTSKLEISYRVAHLIAIDLVKGDSAIAELEQTHILLEQIELESSEKDTIIGFYVKKEHNYLDQIKVYESKEDINKYIIETLEYKNKDLVKKNNTMKKTIKFMGGGIIGIIAIFTVNILLK